MTSRTPPPVERGVEALTLELSRHAFSPRNVARAGDLWRALQDAAVVGSSRVGWDPARYSAEGCAFILRAMTARHLREVSFGERLTAHTWVSTFRRDTFTDRQVRLLDEGGRPVVEATQAWVHVTTKPEVRVARGSRALRDAFTVLADLEPDVALPSWTPLPEAPGWDFRFQAWHTWMDPLAHANHPLYVDWCDEALSRRIAAAGHDPHALVPVAEEVRWRSGVVAPEAVRLTSALIGVSPSGDAVCSHEIRGGDDRICATATTLRRLADGDLVELLSRGA